MTQTFLKLAAITSLTLIAATGTALAQDKKSCADKKAATQTSAMITDAAANQTAVLGASEKTMTTKQERTLLSFDDALKLCNDKAADNLQACIDYKTGVTQTYKTSTS
jgi:hypothetical protein